MLLYERAPTHTTRIRRMMIPTTLATMSKKESKLNGISRTRRRRLIMLVIQFHVFPAHRYAQWLEHRVCRIVGAGAVRAHPESDHGPIGKLTRPQRRLPARDHVFDGLRQGAALAWRGQPGAADRLERWI